MANLIYNTAKVEMWDGTVDLLVNTIKILLVSNAVAYSPDIDDDVVDAGGANDVIDAESNVTNYARGWNAAGRKTLASTAITVDKANDRAEFDAVDVTWTALGNGSNQTVVAGVITKEGGANDTTSRLIAYIDFTDFTTNGADFTLQWDTEGIMQLTAFAGWLPNPHRLLKGLWSTLSEFMSPSMVIVARAFGLRPHVVRFILPLNFKGEVR